MPVFNDKGQLVAVLDIDSSAVGTFDDQDKESLETITSLLSNQCEWPVSELESKKGKFVIS